MKCVRFAYTAGAVGLLLACSGKYNVGQEPASGGSSANPTAGASSSAAGAAVVGDDSAGGASTSAGGGGGDPTSQAGAPASAGAPSTGTAGAAAVVYCGQTLPTSSPAVAFASTTVLWSRVQLFLMGDAKAAPIPVGLPVTPTRGLAGSLADRTLDSLKGAPAPGLTRFVAAWWPGTPNAGAWATLFGDPTATLTDLLTTNSVMNPGSGVLTDPAVLTHAGIPARGVFVDEHLRCLQVPAPPPNVPPLPPAQPGQTRREVLEQAVAQPVCATCHSLINPIGFSLDNYDTVGMFNKLDNGSPIDSSGTLQATNGNDNNITFSDVNDLGAQLAGQCGVSACVTQQLLADAETSANLPESGSADPVAVEQIAFAATSGRLRDLIHAVVESDTFMRAK